MNHAGCIQGERSGKGPIAVGTRLDAWLCRAEFEAQKTKDNEAAQQRAADSIHGRRFERTPEYFAEIKKHEETHGHDFQVVSSF